MPRVLIAGGGIAGPALALFLQKDGVPCALYESHPVVEGVGGGLALMIRIVVPLFGRHGDRWLYDYEVPW